jgi:hypothetical protein
MADSARLVRPWRPHVHWQEHLHYGDWQVCSFCPADFRFGVGLEERGVEHQCCLALEAVRYGGEVQGPPASIEYMYYVQVGRVQARVSPNGIQYIFDSEENIESQQYRSLANSDVASSSPSSALGHRGCFSLAVYLVDAVTHFSHRARSGP